MNFFIYIYKGWKVFAFCGTYSNSNFLTLVLPRQSIRFNYSETGPKLWHVGKAEFLILSAYAKSDIMTKINRKESTISFFGFKEKSES